MIKERTCKVCKSVYIDDDRHGMCIKCYNKWYYQQNKEKIKNNVKNYVKNNREKYRETRRKIDRRRRASMTKEEKQERNRNDWQARKQRMTQEQIEKRKAYSREYYQRNKDKLREQRRVIKQRRRAREKQVVSTLTEDQWLQILKVYKNRCAYCNKKLKNPTQDHVIPVSKGGGYTINNIVPSCMSCNMKKSAGPPPIAVQPLLL